MPNQTLTTTLAAAAAALSLTMSVGHGTAAAQEVTLRLHQFLPAQSVVPSQILDVWADRVEEASGGRIEIQRFPSMQLGGTPPELIDQVIDGTVDIVWTVAGYTPGRFPRAEVFELPFMMTDAEATSRAFWTLAEETMMDADFADFHVLGLWVHGPGVIHSSRPVETVADLEGLTLRAPSRVTTMFFTQMGASAIGMPAPAIPEALSRGVIQATVVPWEVTGALRVAELVDNHTTFGDASLYTLAFIFAMNRDAYEALPADLQAVIDQNSGLEFSAFAGQTQQAADAPQRAYAEDLGNTIIDLDATAVAEWRAAAQPTIDDWIAAMDEAGLDGAGLFERAGALIQEFTAE